MSPETTALATQPTEIVHESFSDYLDRPEVNGSSLVHGLVSMREMKYYLDNQQNETQLMRLGTAAHSLLEYTPEEFLEQYEVMPHYASDPDNCTATGKPSTSSATSKVREKEFVFNRLAKINGKEVIAKKTYDEALSIICALFSHKLCNEVVEASTVKEATILGEVCGVMCKGRIDLLSLQKLWLGDLKTTQTVIPRKFALVSNKFEYCFKMKLYVRILESMGIKIQRVYLLIVESAGANDRVRMPIPEQALDDANKQIDDVLEQYKKCLASGEWPGMFEYDDAPMHIDNWKMADKEELVPFRG